MGKADNLPPSCAVVTKSGNLNFLEPSGPVQACNGTAFFYQKGKGGERHAPAALLSGKRSCTHFMGGCVSIVAGRDGSGKSSPLPPPGFEPRPDQAVARQCND